MAYHLAFSKQANSDIVFYKKSGNKTILKKLEVLLNELIEHLYAGTGKPELLKYNLTGYWSRRINKEYPLVYFITDKM